MGFCKNFRNQGAFEASSIQQIYDAIGKSLTYDVDENFIYPSKLVDGLMLGWTKDKNIQIWPNERNEEMANQVIEMMKSKKMIRQGTQNIYI